MIKTALENWTLGHLRMYRTRFLRYHHHDIIIITMTFRFCSKHVAMKYGDNMFSATLSDTYDPL
jgi:hypothetical protein